MPDWTRIRDRILPHILPRHAPQVQPVSKTDTIPQPPAHARFSTVKPEFPPVGVIEEDGVRLRWHLSVGLWIAPDGGRLLWIDGYALDELGAPATAVQLTGPEDRIEIPVNRRRADVAKALKIPEDRRGLLEICGFSAKVAVCGGPLAARVVLGGKAIDLGEVRLEPQVLFGREGWLFLAGDANDSPAQFSRDFTPDRSWSHDWSAYFKAYRSLQDRAGLASRCFVIAPSKEEVFPDLYPLTRASNPMIDQFLDRFSAEPGMCWPAPQLRDQRELSFDRGETHWSDFGARLVCENLLRDWGLKVPDLPLTFDLRKAAGDLGDKVMPRLLPHRPGANWPNASRLIFNNFALHHGNIRVWANPEAAISETLMIFGGSSSDYMIRYLSALFARVIFVYSAGSWDPDLLEIEKPTRLILQTSQRFLRLPPPPEVRAREIAADKIRRGQITLRGNLAEEMARWTDPSVAPLLL